MKKKVLTLILLSAVAVAGLKLHAKERGTRGKACPDFNSDTCCETGSGNCLETVVIIAKK